MLTLGKCWWVGGKASYREGMNTGIRTREFCAAQTSFKSHGSYGDWKTWKIQMVMEKSWNMNNWPTVMEFCY